MFMQCAASLYYTPFFLVHQLPLLCSYIFFSVAHRSFCHTLRFSSLFDCVHSLTHCLHGRNDTIIKYEYEKMFAHRKRDKGMEYHERKKTHSFTENVFRKSFGTMGNNMQCAVDKTEQLYTVLSVAIFQRLGEIV